MTDEQKMRHEMTRVRDMLGDAVQQIEMEHADIRFFNAAFLSCAMQLHAEVEGPETIERALSKVAVRELVRTGEVGSC